MESLDEVTFWLRYRLARHGRRSKILIDRPAVPDDEPNVVRARLWTTTNVYAIVAKPRSNQTGYLGCVVRTRAPRPGEEHTRGSDLADGDLGDETLNRIMADIVHYESLDITPKLTEMPVDGEFLPGRPVTLMPRTGPLTNADAFTRDPHPTKHVLDPLPQAVEPTPRREQTGEDVLTLLTYVASLEHRKSERVDAVAALERIQIVLKDAGALPT